MGFQNYNTCHLLLFSALCPTVTCCTAQRSARNSSAVCVV